MSNAPGAIPEVWRLSGKHALGSFSRDLPIPRGSDFILDASARQARVREKEKKNIGVSQMLRYSTGRRDRVIHPNTYLLQDVLSHAPRAEEVCDESRNQGVRQGAHDGGRWNVSGVTRREVGPGIARRQQAQHEAHGTRSYVSHLCVYVRTYSAHLS